MKKVLLVLFAALLSAAFFAQGSKAETSVADQIVMPDYYTQGGWKSYSPGAGFINACQQFSPTKNRLTGFDLALSGTGGDFLVSASIRSNYKNSPSTELGQYHESSWANFEESRTMSAFVSQTGSELFMDTSQSYWICVTNMAAGGKWYYNDPTEYSGSLILGVDNTPVAHPTQSFGFRTYGYDLFLHRLPTNSNTNSGTGSNTNTNSTSTSSAGAAPSSNTSSAIAKPTGLKAVYSTTDKAINLTWTGSTTADISGYNIYRSETKGKDYKKIGSTVKATLTYQDQSIAASKTYYYIVRTYKATLESVSSDEVSALVPVDATPVSVASNLPTKSTTSGSTDIIDTGIYWIYGGAILILILLLILYEIERKRKGIKGEVKHFRLSK